MFDDYQSLVLHDYREKKASGRLPLNLLHPTPAKFKSECIAVCEERYLKKDEKLLIAFFRRRDDAAAYRQAIKQFDTEKFKPLCNFLRGTTNSTDEKNIELLAWLINFEPRPYPAWQNLGNQEPAGEPVLPEANNAEPEEKAEENTGKPKEARTTGHNPGLKEEEKVLTDAKGFLNGIKAPGRAAALGRKRNIWLLSTALILIVTATYFVLRSTAQSQPDLTGFERCMYWASDHYQPVLCNQKVDDTPVYALDSLKAANFRKIILPDTITTKALGRVWYVKVNGKIEFYTSGGFHPVYPEKRLRPLTAYIIDKYIRHEE